MAVIDNLQKEYEPLSINEVLNKPFRVIPTEEAMNDVTTVEWSSDVMEGKRKAFLDVPRGDENV